MGINDLLQELEDREIKLQPHLGRLRATGETGRLTVELKAALAQQRIELMVRLGEGQTPPLALDDQFAEAINHAVVGTDLQPVVADVHEAREREHLTQAEEDTLLQAIAEKSRQVPHNVEVMPRSDFATSGLVREVYSNLFDETVLWAADNAVVHDAGGRVYRARELVELEGVAPELHRHVHAVKKMFDGELIGQDEDDPDSKLSALLENVQDHNTCYPCGQSRWWMKECGERVCAVCHPSQRIEDPCR